MEILTDPLEEAVEEIAVQVSPPKQKPKNQTVTTMKMSVILSANSEVLEKLRTGRMEQ